MAYILHCTPVVIRKGMATLGRSSIRRLLLPRNEINTLQPYAMPLHEMYTVIRSSMSLELGHSQDLLDAFSTSQAVEPCTICSELCLGVPFWHQPGYHVEPRKEREVRVSHLVTDKKLCLLFLQVGINDTRDALDLIAVPLDSRGEVLLSELLPFRSVNEGIDITCLWMEHDKPSTLAKVWTLTRHLEV